MRLVFPGDSATAYPSPVVPGNVEPGDSGAFWVTTWLNAGLPGFHTRGVANLHYASLVIEFSLKEHVEMPWPSDLSKGCLAGESPAGPFPQPIPSIP